MKKAVNWSLRQIGKRNLHLNKLAIARADARETKPARWIATTALRELRDEKVQRRLHDKARRGSGR